MAQLRNGDCCPSFVRMILCCLIYDDGGVLLNICDMSDNNGLSVYIVSSTEVNPNIKVIWTIWTIKCQFSDPKL